MQTLMITLFLVSFAALIIVAAIIPRRTTLSRYELERLRDHGSESAKYELRREVALVDIVTLQRILSALFLVFSLLSALGGFGTWIGLLVGVMVALFYQKLSAVTAVADAATRLYERGESWLVEVVLRNDRVFRLLRNVPIDFGSSTTFASRDELQHMVVDSQDVLTPNEKKLITSNLTFSQKKVSDIMTPRNVINTINKDELIGPLMLDTLHKTGHSRFPVLDGDIDHVVGMLYIHELVTLTDKKTHRAESVMEKRVYYINEDQTLDKALAAFLKTHHHLFVVLNGYRETAGVLSLEDVIEAMIGRKITDEYDLDEDLRAVAMKSGAENNNSPYGIDV